MRLTLFNSRRIWSVEKTSILGLASRAFLVLSLVLGATACQRSEIYRDKAAVIDPAAPQHLAPGEGGYRLSAIKNPGSSSGLMILLAFSGGGKRSSAFSYGVLKGLRDMPIRTVAGNTECSMRSMQ